jgi:hypothetical protein
MLILNESKIFSIVYYSTAADKSASYQMLSEQSSTFLVFVTSFSEYFRREAAV